MIRLALRVRRADAETALAELLAARDAVEAGGDVRRLQLAVDRLGRAGRGHAGQLQAAVLVVVEAPRRAVGKAALADVVELRKALSSCPRTQGT